MSKRNTMESIAELFRTRTSTNEAGCIEWNGSRNRGGYGTVGLNGKIMITSRIAWELRYGEIPAGMFVLHRCDNRCCINPDHLFLGTQQDNIADMKRKGRAKSGGARGKQLPQTKISEDDARSIRAMYASGCKQKELAHKFGVTQSAVSMIVTGRNWKYVE